MRYLKWMTLAVIAGLCVIFVIRLSSTLLPFVLRSPASFILLALLELLAGLVLVLFFVLFMVAFPGRHRPLLSAAAALAVAGAVAMLAWPVKFLVTLGLGILAPNLAVSAVTDGLIPLLGSLGLLVFFVVFHLQRNEEEGRALGFSALLAGAGYGMRALVQLAVLARFLLALGGRLPGLPRSFALVLLPLHALTFALVLYFFVQFYLFLSSSGKCAERSEGDAHGP